MDVFELMLNRLQHYTTAAKTVVAGALMFTAGAAAGVDPGEVKKDALHVVSCLSC
jgi:hypothetical protein